MDEKNYPIINNLNQRFKMKKPKKKQPVKVDQTLRGQVLNVVDQLYDSMRFLDKNSPKISLQIIESISLDYASQNCELHFIFEETVIPHLKKMNENQRLKSVKGLLTDGYIDINNQRIHMLFQPYLNYNEAVDSKKRSFITEIPSSDQE